METNEIEKVYKIVERMEQTKAIRHAIIGVEEAFYHKIKEAISSDDFIKVFKDELNIDITTLSEDANSLIIKLLVQKTYA